MSDRLLRATDLVGTYEAAQAIDRTPDRFRQMVREGKVTPVISTRHGNLFLRSDVEALAKRLKQRSAAPIEGRR